MGTRPKAPKRKRFNADEEIKTKTKFQQTKSSPFLISAMDMKKMKKFIDKHNELLNLARTTKASDVTTAAIDNILNTSGGPLLIPTLKNPGEDYGFKLEIGERSILSSLFDVKIINQNKKGLIDAATKPSDIFPGLPMLMFLESADTIVPYDFSKVKSISQHLRETGGVGARLKAAPNVFDKKYRKMLKDEEEEIENLMNNSKNTGGYSQEELDKIPDETESEYIR